MQAYYPIQVALDARLLSGVNAITAGSLVQWSPSATTGNFFAENATFSLANVANTTNKVYARSTLIPVSPSTETLGVGGYDRISGFYAVDVMGALDKGYAATKQLADLVVAAFPRGLQLSLSNGEQITIETTGMAPNITQGAWAMNKLYCVQVQVKFFGYMAP